MKFYRDEININKELWLKILFDNNILDKKTEEILLYLLKCNKYEAAGGEIAQKLKYVHHAPLNLIIPKFSKRILEKYHDIIPPKRGNGNIRYWHIPFLGTETKEHFTWILRNELKEAMLIKYGIENEHIFPEDYINELQFYEGKTVKVESNQYERNPKARKACLDHYGYSCFICGFNFEKCYGEMGKGIIHVHHIKQISELKNIGEHEINPVKDLLPLCPNCHTIIHSKKDPFSVDEVKEMLESNGGRGHVT
jgi:5-methylcytosine-specific restriction protein A